MTPTRAALIQIWRTRKYDTTEIAKALKLPESEVYNSISGATNPDITSRDGQLRHYGDVRARLWKPVPVTKIMEPPPAAKQKKPRKRDLIAVEPAVTKYVTHAKRIILEVVASHGVTYPEIIGQQRSRGIVAARQEAMYRLKKETTLSLERIGRMFDGRDHTTVWWAVQRHAQRLAEARKEVA